MSGGAKGAIYDLAVVGAGPAGLAVAIGARQAGLSVLVAELGQGPLDKACGEGVMPVGLRQLRLLGVLDLVEPSRTAPIRGIRYVNEGGRAVAAPLAGEGGLGIRRVALSAAFLARARAVGVDLREGTRAQWLGRHEVAGEGALQSLSLGEAQLEARFLVAADGLHSKLREQAGLGGAGRVSGARRFGVRQHFAVAPWTDHVEVHFSGNVEAYVTPVGAQEVGIAFLWDADRHTGPTTLEAHLARFPALVEQVGGARATSRARGLGPLAQRPRAVVGQDLALVGDAAGYIDAITGEGISLALDTAAVLVDELSAARSGTLHRYARAHARAFRRYAFLTKSLLWLAARPWLRRRIVAFLARFPALFRVLLQRAL